ncbi:MAG: NADP-dependent oxidoreductase [Acidimicrobiales bacterium]|jgi:NADPH-dependent curcumin reductase CurA
MTQENRRLVLAKRPTGMVDDSTVTLETAPVPEPGEGEALLRVRYLSIDPTIRTWMNDAAGYLPPIGIGELIRSGGIGEVISSNTGLYAAGQLVFGMVGWQDYALAGDGQAAMQVLPEGIDPLAAINVFGITGMTAYFGLLDVGQMKEGDVVAVSGAAGATGSSVGQIAKAKGAGKVIGIAGGPDKCAYVVDELGMDSAIDYKSENVARRLHEEAPKGLDVYFDNVGGAILDAALGNLAMRGRVVLCGAIANYNSGGLPPGPSNYINLLLRRGRMEGFIILDYGHRFAEAQADILTWVLEGKLKHSEHVVEGLEHAPEALNLLFTGGNTGKVVVKL